MDSKIIDLFLRYLNEQCTTEELEEVFSSLEKGTCQEEWKIAIANDADSLMEGKGQTELTEIEAGQIYARIEDTLKRTPVSPAHRQQPVKRILPAWLSYSAAAILIVACSIGGYFYLNRTGTGTNIQSQYTHDIQPGSNKAALTLADGTRISLTEVKNGKLAEQAGVKISKTEDGQLSYEIAGQTAGKEMLYNTVATPKGGQYRIELPDGTGVWLNAASSIKFPVTFSGARERKVQLNGEAYFEVAKDKSHPFVVSTNRQEVQVLGTHFIVNGYTDEPNTKTILLEGAIQVSPLRADLSADAEKTVLLKPGQQSILLQESLKVSAVDIEEAMAWKNGYFRFNDESLESIMRKLARWYDIDVAFQGYKNNGGFTGTISRNKTIVQVLTMLEKTKDIHFKIEGRRITVMP